MSSDDTASTMALASRLVYTELRKAPRIPITCTTSTSSLLALSPALFDVSASSAYAGMLPSATAIKQGSILRLNGCSTMGNPSVCSVVLSCCSPKFGLLCFDRRNDSVVISWSQTLHPITFRRKSFCCRVATPRIYRRKRVQVAVFLSVFSASLFVRQLLFGAQCTDTVRKSLRIFFSFAKVINTNHGSQRRGKLSLLLAFTGRPSSCLERRVRKSLTDA